MSGLQENVMKHTTSGMTHIEERKSRQQGQDVRDSDVRDSGQNKI